jgi:hypothetical protein
MNHRLLFSLRKTCCSCRWGETMSLNCSHHRAYCSSPSWYITMDRHGGKILTGENRRTWRKICTSATLFTTNPTWTNPAANTDLRGERPSTTTFPRQSLAQEFSFPLKVGWMPTYISVYAFPRWYEFGERRSNCILTGENRRTRRKTCPSANSSITNPT